jgi:hypothetical protein
LATDISLQPSPTLTQFTTDVSTSYTERTTVTTEVVTNPSPGLGLKVRQGVDVNATISTADSTNSVTNDTFFINDISTTIRTVTFTDAVLVTK